MTSSYNFLYGSRSQRVLQRIHQNKALTSNVAPMASEWQGYRPAHTQSHHHSFVFAPFHVYLTNIFPSPIERLLFTSRLPFRKFSWKTLSPVLLKRASDFLNLGLYTTECNGHGCVNLNCTKMGGRRLCLEVCIVCSVLGLIYLLPVYRIQCWSRKHDLQPDHAQLRRSIPS